MSHRILTSAVAIVLSLSVSTFLPSDASAASGKILAMRTARLRLHSSTSSIRSSSSSSTSLAWEKLRLSKRRGGGGSGQRTARSGSSSQHVVPTITLSNITKNFGDANFALLPTSDSPGAFTFESSNTSVATISGNIVAIVHAGSTTITVTQAAHGNFAGNTATATVTVSKIAPTIVALISITKNSTDPPFTLSDPMSNSDGAFTFTSTNTSVAIISGRTVTLAAPGTATIISTQAATTDYKSGSGTTSLTVNVGLEDS